MKKYILAIDEGTSSARAILFDFQANPVAIGRSDFPLYYPEEAWVEQNALEIFQAQIQAIQECLNHSKIDISEIQAVGITNQRETTVLWDTETGLPVYNAIVWQDRRTTDRCDELRKLNLTEKIKNKTGLVPDPYFSATKIEWILNHVPGVREKANAGKIKFGTIDTWLLWKLTEGKVHATDVSNASRTLLFNIQNLSWDKELLELFGIPESILPNVCPSAHDFGEMNWQGTKIPILSMIGDQQSATFGQACFEAGSVKNTYGTGCFMLMNTGKNICSSENGLISTIAWQIGTEVTYALEGAIFSAGASVQWLLESGLVQSIEEMTALASGLTDNGDVYLVPAFAGLGAPQWDPTARGCLIGLTRGTTKAHISRAALEGMAFQSDETLSAMRLDSGLKIPKIKVDGGASNNSFLMQFQANVSQVNIERPVCTETTAMGAAFLAGLQAGVYSTLSDIQSVWKLDQTFEIQQDDNHERLKKRWQEAVKRSLHWA